MFSQLAWLEITCDAPPYEIVRDCETIGFWSPLDVRWCRMDSTTPKCAGWWRRLWDQVWQTLLGSEPSCEPCCTCGCPLPTLRTFEFTFLGGKAIYCLGQCPCCRTMFWQEA